jgi:catechol 2,3-dioxygenase-like lactoylglutathione lyase family enzyme
MIVYIFIGRNRPLVHTLPLREVISSIQIMPRLLLTASLLPVSLLLAGAATGQAPQPQPNAVRLTKYILGVADLDRSYAFYHALGLDFERPTTLPKPTPLSNALLKLVDVPPGTKFRNMMLKVPGAPFSLEVTEFSNLDLHPVRPRLQDPGASLLTLIVPDAGAAMEAAKRAGAKDVTTGVVEDPDGYYLEFQSGPAGASFASVVQDAEKAVAFYRGLGFETTAGTPASKKSRTMEAKIPGTTLVWRFVEFKGSGRKAYIPRIPDPGAAALGLQVHDLDAAVAAVKAAGGKSITQSGSSGLGNGKVGFVRDPSGILVELAQPK